MRAVKLALLLLWMQLLFTSVAANAVDYLSFATEDETNSMEVFDKASPASSPGKPR
jgi:hypothetical protein